MSKSAIWGRVALAFGLWVASIGSPANSAEPKAGDVIENSIKMKLAYVPPGEFEMGSPETEKGRKDSEKLHHVKLTKGFYLGAHEVTQGQFQRVLTRNPSWFSERGFGKPKVSGKDTATFPVEQVSWFDAIDFCNALSKSEGLPEYYALRNVRRDNGSLNNADVTENGGSGYRLPTEAEWEYACRAGTKTPFHFGETPSDKEANISVKSPFLERTEEVGRYAPNKFGLYDMHGNVSEWCNDRCADYGGDAVDPKGPDSGGRVLRGGSFLGLAHAARSANRYADRPTLRSLNGGFRVARTSSLAP